MKSILLVMSLILLFSGINSFVARAQVPANSITGRYEGIAKSKLQGDVPVVLQIKLDGKDIVGVVNTPFGDFPIDGSYTAGQINVKFAPVMPKALWLLLSKTILFQALGL